MKRLLIEKWLPVDAIGVECMRENSTGLHPPPHRLHIWWTRKPLAASRAAVLASLLPDDFDRECFERLLGFYAPSAAIAARARELAAASPGTWVPEGHGPRAFGSPIRPADARVAHDAARQLWGQHPAVLDPMAGGGSIRLEAARLGLATVANELNPVACSVLEATLLYPQRFGQLVGDAARKWAAEWVERFDARMRPAYRYAGQTPPRDYIFARTVPCPDTGHPTPLVHDWSLSRPAGGPHIVAEPVVTDPSRGKWTIRVRRVGRQAGDLPQPPPPTYARGKGISLFTGAPLSDDYIKANAQMGRMGSVLYAVVLKTGNGMEFRPAEDADLQALEAAERELARLRPQWERDGIIPTEEYPEVSTDPRPRTYGMRRWADMFSPRQLLAMGTLVEELLRLRPEIIAKEGEELGEAVIHLLALVVDKFGDYNSLLATWESTRQIVKHGFQRHDYSFKPVHAEMAACVAGSGLEWAIDNVLDAYEKLAALPRVDAPASVGCEKPARAAGAQLLPTTHNPPPITIHQGSATNLASIPDKSVTAVVVDPPYAGNVQYSELADFFYVWLKRTQGHRHPDWFASYLCDHDQEAVVNVSRFRGDGEKAAEARQKSQEAYQTLITESFKEANRVLRDDGVLTVMFTHKRQDAWAALFQSLIDAGFTITATWPVRTESQHSLHIAGKNAAESTVILAARKREGAQVAYYDAEMQNDMRKAARKTAARLTEQGLNRVDVLVGTFGPAMQVFTRYKEVRHDTGERVDVAEAIQLAANEVLKWQVEQVAQRGLEGVDPESRFYLLCWDVMEAGEFRFNEAMLLGRAVGMDVERLKEAGLVARQGENVRVLPAAERRREQPIRTERPGAAATLFGGDPEVEGARGRGRRTSRQVHPQDEVFGTAIDACHALALEHAQRGGGEAGLGAARSLARRQGWTADSPCARLMEALVNAAPQSVRFVPKASKRKGSDKEGSSPAERYPEFRAWHAMLKPLFGIEPPEWKEPPQRLPDLVEQAAEPDEGAEDEDE